MQLSDKLYGWIVNDVKESVDTKATMYILEHERCGTKMIYVEREDVCKTFAVSFETIPTDDTGVFHILEHSVLCGSRKFPLKEPFTSLMQTSPNCFLNAWTYPTKTVYPVSSKSAKDFHNLVDIYMDAVLHPLAIEDERIFRQEGWRYEIDEGGALGYNGVVYSEMKGDFSSPSELLNLYIGRLQYPGGTHSFESGGLPEAITTLSYEDFVNTHKEYYHPSGALIYLDGSIDVDDIFPLLDGYLREYDRLDVSHEVVRGAEAIEEPFVGYYEITENEQSENNTYLALAYSFEQGDNIYTADDVSLIISAISGTNSSPFKKPLIDSGLCGNVTISSSRIHTWGSLDVTFRNVKDGCEEELIALFDKTIADIVSGGIADDLLSSSIDLKEFLYREGDYGSMPRGIGMLPSIISLYYAGFDPSLELNCSLSFKRQRELVGTDYYTSLLRRITEGRRAVVILHPSTTVASEEEARLAAELEEAKAEFGEAGMEQLQRWCESFCEWQSTPDSEEAMASIPRLTLSDLSEPPTPISLNVTHEAGARIVTREADVRGITYTDLFFDASDIPLEDIHILGIICQIIAELDTTEHSANDFITITKSVLGNLSTGYETVQDDELGRVYLAFSFSYLERNRKRALEIIEECIYKKSFNDPEKILRILTQVVNKKQNSIAKSGESYAVNRASARYSTTAAIKEMLSGYEGYLRMKEYVDGGEAAIAALIEKITAIYAKISTRPRLTMLVVASSEPRKIATEMLSIIKDGEGIRERAAYKTFDKINEAIPVPSQVGYAAMSARLTEGQDRDNLGRYVVFDNIMNNIVLWNKIRVGGGAYAAGSGTRLASKGIYFYSYRDPSPRKSLAAFKEATDDVRRILNDGIDLEKLKIGTIGTRFMQASTPYWDTTDAFKCMLVGYPYDYDARLWKSIIEVKAEDVIAVCDEYNEALEDASFAAVGPRALLDELEDHKTLNI